MTDNELILKIRDGKYDAALKALYKEFPKVKANICSTGGTKEIAEEIFDDALVLLIEKVQDPQFILTSKISTYLFGICRFLWKNQLRKLNKNIELEWNDTLILKAEDLDYASEQEERFKELEVIIGKLTQKCQEIFERFYFKKESMAVISKALGFSSVNSAKTQKYKCLEKASKLALANNLKSE